MLQKAIDGTFTLLGDPVNVSTPPGSLNTVELCWSATLHQVYLNDEAAPTIDVTESTGLEGNTRHGLLTKPLRRTFVFLTTVP